MRSCFDNRPLCLLSSPKRRAASPASPEPLDQEERLKRPSGTDFYSQVVWGLGLFWGFRVSRGFGVSGFGGLGGLGV